MSEKKLPQGITLRKDGRYMWRFKYAGVTYSGYAHKLPEAKRALTDKRYEVEHGLSNKEKSITLDAWFDEWMKTYKACECKETTLHIYEMTYKRYIKPEFGGMQLKKIRTDAVQKFFNKLSEKYSRGTVTQTRAVFSSCMGQAVKCDFISKSPFDNVTNPKCKAVSKKRAVTAEEERTFLDAAKGSRYYELYRLASLTGMRLGEITGLQWCDIDFEKGIIHVTHTKSYTPGKGTYLATPKTKSSLRDIPIKAGGEAYNLLKYRRREQAKQRMFYGSMWQAPEGMENLVFTNHLGGPVVNTCVDRETEIIIDRLKEKGVDLDGFTFHTLRHCFATRAIEAGMEPKVLQSILGHTSFSMTMDLYCDTMEESKRAEMEKIQMAL